MIERHGKLTIKGKPLTLLGAEVVVGQQAPDFSLRTGFGPETAVTLASTGKRIRIFSVAPSLDTGICEKQAIRFNEEAAVLGEQVVIYQISVDLPPAMSRFCSHQLGGNSSVTMLSDYAEKTFGMSYGILIKEWQTLGRGIFVVDEGGLVRYVEYVPEIAQEPDYERALLAVKDLLRG